jgi:uncharacterized membrane protein SpoIIM required for sporulation
MMPQYTKGLAVNRERFIRQRRSDWQQFEALVARLRARRQRTWASRDVSDLSRLYRSICYDLSLVQSREWGSRLEQYLNDLVAQGHNALYRSAPRSLSVVWDFFAFEFPRTFRRRIGAFCLSLALFLIPFLVSTLVGWQRPEIAEMIAGKESLEAASQNFGQELYTDMDAKYAGQRSAMAGFYVKNNTGIAFQAYALGAFIGLGTCFVLLSNGISIGMVTGYILSVGYPTTENFFSFVISHGSFELTAIVISGGGGFVLAHGILFPGQRTRMDSLRHNGLESLKLALGAGAMLAVAALLEGYFSPLPMPAIIKYVVGSCLWLLVISYLSFAGRGGTVNEG